MARLRAKSEIIADKGSEGTVMDAAGQPKKMEETKNGKGGKLGEDFDVRCVV